MVGLETDIQVSLADTLAMPNVKPIELDGSTLEGGGQLVRVALSLSAITGIPVHIYNVRANRAPQGRSKQDGKAQSRGGRSKGGVRGGAGKAEGGLKESHLAAVIYLARMCNAYVEGAEVGSRDIAFIPGADHDQYKTAKAAKPNALVDFETNTIELRNPGSVWLILQAILPFFIFGKDSSPSGSAQGQRASTSRATTPSNRAKEEDAVHLTLKGGTNVSKSMSGEYAQHVLLPILHRIGLPLIECDIKDRGWAGNASKIGEVHIRMRRSPIGRFKLPSFEVRDRGDIEKLTVHMVSGDRDKEDLEQVLKGVIAEYFAPDLPVDVLGAEDSGDPRRLYLLLVAHTTNGWRLGQDFLSSGRTPKNEAERGKMIDHMCQTVVMELKRELKRGGCVDEYLQDQLVIFQALGSGTSVIDGGDWGDHQSHEDPEYGDAEGSLHSRTVRWVCERMLRKQGVEFESRGKCRGIGWDSSSGDAATEKLEALCIQ